ncbi:glycosyltransferase family 4 protein [Vagococcus fluvialis]|uniref:glycosyltransferase family 4 protein n=1 Tax=Vagococcus fluvialis TaxID=2738 RepID=UPI001A8E3C0F|nr:glycosyltransferase family 4 protein [Vagococcus fluvialis]MBO0487235.1 glycosyltransferase family 4 protein [Vagococcus fluvialis]
MKILFLTLLDINDFNEKNIYTDVLREFIDRNHNVTIVSPTERRNWKKRKTNNVNGDIIKVKIGNITKTNIVEKGITTLMIDKLYLRAIKKLDNIKFDVVIYSTPPITFTKTINYLKKKDNLITYLLLKDIFPQNAVDLEMMKKNSIIYKYFRKKEKKLYEISDCIGCMSQRNMDYILKNNKLPNLINKVHISPNSTKIEKNNEKINIEIIRERYNLPVDKTIFVYGGNIGKPQGINFFLECLKKINSDNKNAFFVVIGSGTEFERVKQFASENNLSNLKIIDNLPVKEFSNILLAMDVGLVLLDCRFTIPNFPSRLLSYLQAELPILSATDLNTDIGEICENNGFGIKVSSNNHDAFIRAVDSYTNMEDNQKIEMRKKAYCYLEKNYSSSISYKIITNEIEKAR